MNVRAGQTARPAIVLIMAAALVLAGWTTAVAQEHELSDVAIGDAVFDELVADQVVSAHWIDVVSEDGVVTLDGRVGSILAKDRAARIAGTVKGVRGVVNVLDVLPPPATSDTGLKADVEAALLSDPATDLYEIEVHVEDGFVTLEGRVDSWQEKKLCGTVVKDVIGVAGVHNNIVIDAGAVRSDEEIAADIEQAIWWDALIDGDRVDLTVRNEAVTFSGSVASLAEKRRVIDHAYLGGAEKVDATALIVAWWLFDGDAKQDASRVVTDHAIRDAVRDVLFRDPRVSPFRIVVGVDDGIVTLRGTVDNLKAKEAASRSARNTVGVIRVVNRLKIRPTAIYLDADIKSDIERAFRRDPFIEREEITVAVHAGVVELGGAVGTAFERSRAEELAMRINGVVGVNNHLRVSSGPVPFPYDPYVDDWYARKTPYTTDPDGTRTTKSDLDIAVDVENQLYWSPFVDSDTVHIDVEDGVVTLTGTFSSRSEFTAATKNAYDGGAIAVRNELVYDPDS